MLQSPHLTHSLANSFPGSNVNSCEQSIFILTTFFRSQPPQSHLLKVRSKDRYRNFHRRCWERLSNFLAASSLSASSHFQLSNRMARFHDNLSHVPRELPFFWLEWQEICATQPMNRLKYSCIQMMSNVRCTYHPMNYHDAQNFYEQKHRSEICSYSQTTRACWAIRL